ncbi:MAG: sulfate reduction electron transfer complex DsrMKJOP subunit DsrJ [Nitrospirota bacterium]
MYDGWKVILGIIIFIGIVTFPILYDLGKAAPPPPEPKIDTPEIQRMVEKKCIEPKSLMKTEHMVMLNDWRDKVVREALQVYVATDGNEYVMSLQNTCMRCHSNKKKFCDVCHNYAAVAPYCWDCHIEPKEEGQT